MPVSVQQIVAVALAACLASTAAEAEVVTLVCDNNTEIEIDFTEGLVRFGNPDQDGPSYSAEVSENQIKWSYHRGVGEPFGDFTYTLDRISGVLSIAFYCTERDPALCSVDGTREDYSSAQCHKATRQF